MQVASVSHEDAQSDLQLLKLPDTALNLVLQQLDPCSMACTAVTCSKLCHAAPAALRRLAVRCKLRKAYKTLSTLHGWLKQHSLTNLVECSIINIDASSTCSANDWVASHRLVFGRLPCPQLRQLQLQRVSVQLEAGWGAPGLLHDCTGLTGLDLMQCEVQDSGASVEAITALQQLQRIRWLSVKALYSDRAGWECCFADLQRPEQVTNLSLSCRAWCASSPSEEGFYSDQCSSSDASTDTEQLPFPNLSAYINLQHLDLTDLPTLGVPGGVPSQLAQLTALSLQYYDDNEDGCNVAEQLQHLSALIELKEFRFSGCSDFQSEDISEDSFNNTDTAEFDLASKLDGIGYLLQLTSLALAFDVYLGVRLQFSTSSTRNWACLTALQSLSLSGAAVEPQALAALTQLQALTLGSVDTFGDVPYEELLHAVSQLTLLTQLHVDFRDAAGFKENPPSAAAFTALTASTNLCSLQVTCPVVETQDDVANKLFFVSLVQGCVLLEAGRSYPRLRRIDLQFKQYWGGVPVSEQQLQVLCSCCPALESLSCVLDPNALPEASLALLQLSALTHLELQQQLQFTELSDAVAPAVAAATAAVVGVAAQLTGLKQLVLRGLTALTDPVLWQLTALRALEDLTLRAVDATGKQHRTIFLQGPVKGFLNQARWGNPPDVWRQLAAALQPAALQAAAPREQVLQALPPAVAAHLSQMQPGARQEVLLALVARLSQNRR